MKVSTHTNAVAFAMVCLLISQAISAAQPWYELQIVLPSSANGQVTTQLTGGWPLVIRATAPSGAPTYAYDNDSGPLAVVAADPSGCFDDLFFSDPDSACLSQAPDEVYTSPWLDLDAPGREDVSSGDSDLIRALVDSEGGGGPVFFGLVAGSETSVTAGPDTGGEVRDGYGYGANDDWPQLVLLSNRGVGVALDEHFNRGPTEERRNLAAFLEWVAYDLADAKGRSAVSSGTIVPYALFSPLILVDEAIGQPDATGDAYIPGFKFRIDGGPDQSGVRLPAPAVFRTLVWRRGRAARISRERIRAERPVRHGRRQRCRCRRRGTVGPQGHLVRANCSLQTVGWRVGHRQFVLQRPGEPDLCGLRRERRRYQSPLRFG